MTRTIKEPFGNMSVVAPKVHTQTITLSKPIDDNIIGATIMMMEKKGYRTIEEGYTHYDDRIVIVMERLVDDTPIKVVA